eukprot:gene10723-7454_t
MGASEAFGVKGWLVIPEQRCGAQMRDVGTVSGSSGNHAGSPLEISLLTQIFAMLSQDLWHAWAGRRSGAPFELPRRVFITLEEWTPENEMLTVGLKIKRKSIEEKYAAEMDLLFDSDPSQQQQRNARRNACSATVLSLLDMWRPSKSKCVDTNEEQALLSADQRDLPLHVLEPNEAAAASDSRPKSSVPPTLADCRVGVGSWPAVTIRGLSKYVALAPIPILFLFLPSPFFFHFEFVFMDYCYPYCFQCSFIVVACTTVQQVAPVTEEINKFSIKRSYLPGVQDRHVYHSMERWCGTDSPSPLGARENNINPLWQRRTTRTDLPPIIGVGLWFPGTSTTLCNALHVWCACRVLGLYADNGSALLVTSWTGTGRQRKHLLVSTGKTLYKTILKNNKAKQKKKNK